MSRYTTFITDRLNEDTTIPPPAKTALRTLASIHDGHPYCTGCGTDPDHYDAATLVEECEQAAAIAAIWKHHPDHPEKQEEPR